MKPYYDDRDYIVPRLQDYETRVLQEIREAQVTYPDISEYAPGSERLERLYEAMETANRFQHPNSMEPNL